MVISAMENHQAGKQMESVREGVEAVCGAKRKWAVREGCSEEVPWGQRPGGDEEVSHTHFWGKGNWGRQKPSASRSALKGVLAHRNSARAGEAHQVHSQGSPPVRTGSRTCKEDCRTQHVIIFDDWFITLKGYKTKSALGGASWDEVWRKLGANFQEFPPSGVHSIELSCDNTWEVLPPRKAQ